MNKDMTEPQQPKAAPTNNQNSLDEILDKVWAAGFDYANATGDKGTLEDLRNANINDRAVIPAAKAAINKTIMEARADGIYSMHDSIMQGELKWPDVKENAWLNATIHRWIDKQAKKYGRADNE